MAMRCLTSAIAGLRAHQTAIDVVGNNISNVDTNGFKSGSVAFRDTLYQQMTAASAGNTAAGIAGVNPSQIGYGSSASSISIDTACGPQNVTGSGSDVYINGDGYLVIADGGVKEINTADGTSSSSADDSVILPTSTAHTLTDASAVKFTRVGHLKFDSNGYLTDGNGNFVLGRQYLQSGVGDAATYKPYQDLYTGTESGKKTAGPSLIKYNPAADKQLKDVAIAGDGTITATYNGKTITVGQIALSNFPNASGLTMSGDSYYKQSNNSGSAAYSDPGVNATGKLVSGALEASNVDLANEFSNTIMYERGYQAITKMISVADEMYQTLVNMK